jgi:hypothetical protein
MNVFFDKEMYTQARSLETTSDDGESTTNNNKNKVESESEKAEEGKSIEKAIKESLANGKVGALSVDPNYLEFEPLASEYFALGLDSLRACFEYPTINSLLLFSFLVVASEEKSATSKILEYLQLSEVRLYIVLALIAALVFVAIVQATCTIMRTRSKSKRHKVSPA